jgi:NADH-quinone oxidoreductase subunit F
MVLMNILALRCCSLEGFGVMTTTNGITKDSSRHPQILLAHVNDPDQYKLATYERSGGYQAIRRVLGEDPLALIEGVKKSGLRGRGGAGFPTGVKWGFVPRGTGKPVYLINNADESEPGTFKDRVLLERDPHLCIEGMLIAAWALQSEWSCIYIRGEYGYPYIRIKDAVEEAYARGYLGENIFGSGFTHHMVVHRGAGAYICGEETGLINSLEGFKGQPRLKPPFPAVVGLYSCPTVVNNTETLAALPWIVMNGAESYAALGTQKSPGTKLFSASGHINKPGVYEVELGYPILDFIQNECGGILDNRRLKAVIPGGSSVPVLRYDELAGVNLDYESLRDAGSMLGSGGFIVMDDTVDMVDAALNLAHFYSHESCGQCTPCREGGHWIEKIFKRIARGNGLPGDMELINNLCGQIAGHTICPFGEALATPATSFMKKFPEEFKRRIALALEGGQSFPPSMNFEEAHAAH